MRRFVPFVIAATVLSGCGVSSPRCPSPDARSIVRALNAREHLRSMLINVGKTTTTGQIVAKQDPDHFDERLSAAVQHAVDRHGATWEANMVSAYSTALSANELKAACSAMNEGDRGAFMPFANRVGLAMKGESEALLNTAGAEMLAELFEGTKEQ